MTRSKLAGLALICSLASGCGKDILIDGRLQPVEPIKMELNDKTSKTWSRYLHLRTENGKSNAESDLVNVLLVLDKDADGEVEFNELRKTYQCEIEVYQEAHPDCCLNGKSCRKQEKTAESKSEVRTTGARSFCFTYQE